jgi:hypothetical protein
MGRSWHFDRFTVLAREACIIFSGTATAFVAIFKAS